MSWTIVGAAGRRSIAREKPESTAERQGFRVIVNDHREQSSVDRLLLQGSRSIAVQSYTGVVAYLIVADV
ncbi:hypothetical protein EMIT0P218_210018 [Pseudomonas sp. IT-P218]